MTKFPFGAGKGGMKTTGAGPAGRGGMRLHTAATATASAAAGARGHLMQKPASHGPASRTSLGSRPLTAGKVRQQDHWLSDFWPQRAPLHSAVTAQVTAVGEAPAAAEPAGHKSARSSPRSSFDRQQDLPLPDEPTTPAQQREGPFLDAATSSTESADAPVESQAEVQAEVQPPAASAAEPQAAPAPSAPAPATAEPAAALDMQQQQQQRQPQQQPSSPSSDAASSVSPSINGGDGFRFSAPGNVVVNMLIPRAVAGWLLGPGGATAKANQVHGTRWSLSNSKWALGGHQNLRLLHIQGPPARTPQVVHNLFSLLMAEGAPKNKAFFRTKAGQYKMKVTVPTWLVGTLLGKEGHIIRSIQEATGTRMQIVPLVQALKPGPKGGLHNKQKLGGAESVLEVAADTVDSIASGVQMAFEAILANPKYKPFIHKSPEDYVKVYQGSQRSSSHSGSEDAGVARAA